MVETNVGDIKKFLEAIGIDNDVRRLDHNGRDRKPWWELVQDDKIYSRNVTPIRLRMPVENPTISDLLAKVGVISRVLGVYDSNGGNPQLMYYELDHSGEEIK